MTREEAIGDLMKIHTEGLEQARVDGFADCEELIASMLERMAGGARAKARGTDGEDERWMHNIRATVLTEAALAVRLGQHRREVES